MIVDRFFKSENERPEFWISTETLEPGDILASTHVSKQMISSVFVVNLQSLQSGEFGNGPGKAPLTLHALSGRP